MILRTAGRTDVGLRRQANEDSYALSPEHGLFLVADGMGGHRAGQVASRLSADAALRAVDTLQGVAVGPAEKLRHAVAVSNREVFAAARANPELAGMGTTFVALLASAERAALAHVGDSRAYLIRAGQIRRLTDDHSLVGELLRRQEITEDAARDHPHRHVLTRALGVRPKVEPDLAEISPAANDVFLLCSDGLTTLVLDEEILEMTRRATDLQIACDSLVDLANSRGGVDNTTVVMVYYEKGGE
jgi:protein phosphatase